MTEEQAERILAALSANVIATHRVYDVLLLLLDEEDRKLIQADHAEGRLLGPTIRFAGEEDDNT